MPLGRLPAPRKTSLLWQVQIRRNRGQSAEIQRNEAIGKKTVHNPEPCLIGIDGNDRFIRRQKRFGLINDVVKLGVPIHRAAAFPGFTVGLQTVSQFTQAVSNHVRANRMTLTVQRLCQVAQTWMSSAAPASGHPGLPSTLLPDLERLVEPESSERFVLRPPPRPAYPPGFCRLLLRNNLFHATTNRTAGHAGDPRHQTHTAITVGAGLSSGKPPPPPSSKTGDNSW